MPAEDRAPQTPRRDVILIAGASPEGQTIASALRAQGFAVAFAPIERLEARVLADAPRVLLVDIDEPGARDAVERLRELDQGNHAELICLGNLGKAAEVGAMSAHGRAFARPLDIHAILAQAAALVEPAPLDDSVVEDHGVELALRPGETVPPGAIEDGTGSFPDVFQSAFPGAPEVAEMGGSIFPPDENDGHSPPTLLPTHPMQLSPDLMGLLATAEQRVLAEIPNAASAHPPALGAIEEDGDIILADELLAMLDEPLDANDLTPPSGPSLAQSGAIDPGTGPNVLLGITTSALAALSISDANPVAQTPSTVLGQTEAAALTYPDPLRRSYAQESPRTPNALVTAAGSAEGRASLLAAASPPRISEPRKSIFEGPATAWDSVRSARPSLEEQRPAVRITQPSMPAVSVPVAPEQEIAPPANTPRARRPTLSSMTTAPSPGQHPRQQAVSIPHDPTLDLAPPTVMPARLAARRAAQSGAPNDSSPQGFVPPTAQSLAMGRVSADPPPSVRLAPPVPPPPAPVAKRPESPAAGAELQPKSRRPSPAIATALGQGDAPRALARAISSRATGALAFVDPAASTTRRVLLHEGDMVTASSGLSDESLVSFLASRGDLERDVASRMAGRLPSSGRHAGAALVAHGYLAQDALWPVLRAHAEWLIGRAIAIEAGTLDLEIEPPARLRAEPSVFGGATGAEVFVEIIRRITPPELAILRLGGAFARVDSGARSTLLAECALGESDVRLVGCAPGQTVRDVVESGGPESASLLWALVCLDVLSVLVPARADAKEKPPAYDPLDEEAVRMRVRARLALVDDGDYFALLGLGRSATGYEIRHAYLELRRAFEPERLLTAATSDLLPDVRLVLEVLDEAYEILKDHNRRERYRRAIEAGPPS